MQSSQTSLQTGSQVSSPALWISGGALFTSLGTAIYLNKQLSSLNDEIQKHSKRLSSSIIEISRIKSIGGNVNKIAEATRMLNIEGGRQNELINEMKDLISEFDQIFENLMPQVNDNSRQMHLMFNAINELQDVAKQNGWKIRTNISSNPAIIPPSDLYSRQNNEVHPSIEDVNNYGESGRLDENLPHSHQESISSSSVENSPYSQTPKLTQNDRSKRSQGYSNQRYEYTNSTRNNSSSRDRSPDNRYFKDGRSMENSSRADPNRLSRKHQSSVRFSLKSDQRSPERNYHQHQTRDPQPTISQFRSYPPYISRINPKIHNRQFRPPSFHHDDQRQPAYHRTSYRSSDLDHRHQNNIKDHESSSRNDSVEHSTRRLNLNLDGDLNGPPDVKTTSDGTINNEDNTKNEILARISL